MQGDIGQDGPQGIPGERVSTTYLISGQVL